MSKSIVERIRREQRARQAGAALTAAPGPMSAAAGQHPEVAFIEAFLTRFSADIVPLVSRSLSAELKSALSPIYDDLRGSIKETLDATTSELNKGIAALQQTTDMHESSGLMRPIDVDSDLIAKEVSDFVDRVASRDNEERWDGSADTDLEIPIAELKSELERIMSDPSSFSGGSHDTDEADELSGEQDTMMLDDDATDSKEWLSTDGVFGDSPEPSGELMTESMQEEELSDLSDLEHELADLEALGDSAVDHSVTELLDASQDDSMHVVEDDESGGDEVDDVDSLGEGELSDQVGWDTAGEDDDPDAAFEAVFDEAALDEAALDALDDEALDALAEDAAAVDADAIVEKDLANSDVAEGAPEDLESRDGLELDEIEDHDELAIDEATLSELAGEDDSAGEDDEGSLSELAGEDAGSENSGGGTEEDVEEELDATSVEKELEELASRVERDDRDDSADPVEAELDTSGEGAQSFDDEVRHDASEEPESESKSKSGSESSVATGRDVPSREDYEVLLAKVDANYDKLVEKIDYVEVLIAANFESLIARVESTVAESVEKLAGPRA